jgi:hypothetical protein
MNDQLLDIRTPLALSPHTRVEVGRDGVLHVLVGPITLHLDRGRCEELTTTLARAMIALTRAEEKVAKPALVLIQNESSGPR